MEPHLTESKRQGRRFVVERLEDRLAPAHLGHEVVLPAAAAAGAQGLQAAIAAPADHRRASIIAILIG